MYYSSYTKFVKAYFYIWNLLFQVYPQPFQCLKDYRNYVNLNRDILQTLYSTEAAGMWRNVIRYIVPKPALKG